MKKLLLTVFAVVGFSTISIANNQVEVKTLHVEDLLIAGDPCVSDQEAAFDDCKSNGCNDVDATFFAAGQWGRCMAGKGIRG